MNLGLLFGHEVSLMLKLSCLGYGTLAHCWSCLWCSTLSDHYSCLWGGTLSRDWSYLWWGTFSHHWSYLWWGTACHHWFCLWRGTPTLPLVLSMIWLPPLIVGSVWDVGSLLTAGSVWDVVPPLTASPFWNVLVLSGMGYPVTIGPVIWLSPLPRHSRSCLGCSSTIGSVSDMDAL